MNNDIWYNNPKILFNNLNNFFPDKDLPYNEKINSLVRFACYYALLIILFNFNINYLFISLILILISYYFGNYYNHEKFINSINIPSNIPMNTSDNISTNTFNNNNTQNNTNTKDTCTKPTVDNPFMNYTVGDLIENPNKSPACKYEDVKNEMHNTFRKDMYADSSDLWGTFISDRNFYSMPNTGIVNNQIEFAKWCYDNNPFNCKSTGHNCLKERDPTYHRGRITTSIDDNMEI